MKQNYMLRLSILSSFLFFSFLTFAQPTLVMTGIDASCNGGSDGAASATAVGGTSPYTYFWVNSATTSLISNVVAGTYTVTVTDNNGLSVVDSAIVGQPTAVVGSVTVDSNANCFASADGGATASASGGTAPYTYNWSNASSSASITGIMVGIYTVTITDANACTTTSLAIVNSDDNIKPLARAKDTTLYLDFNGQLTVTSAAIDSSSSDNCTIATFQVLNNTFGCSDVGANTVRLIAVDSDGNRDTASAVVTVVDSIPPTIVTQTYTAYLDANGAGTFMASDINNGSSDVCGLDSIWADTNIVLNCSNIGANTVWLYASDVNGNIDSATATVNVVDTFPVNTTVFTEVGCGTYTWAQNGQTYTAAGTYNDTARNSLGCDSMIFVLNLSIDTVVNMVDTITACDSYAWRDGNIYTSNNSAATFAVQNSNNCDSIVYTLNLTINSSDSVLVFKDSACVSYTWTENNQTYTSSGVYTNVLTNAQGCDSIISLDLEIRELNLSVINVGDSLFAFARGNSYQWYNCDTRSIIPGATRSGYRPDTTGHFSVIIDNGLCSDTSTCQEVIIIGLDEKENSKSALSIYPNPTNRDFFFEMNKMGEDDQLFVYDLNGRIILQKTVKQLKEKIETNEWKAGIYFVRYNDVIQKLVITK